MLYTVDLGLFKHIMDGFQVFLKKHERLETVDDFWKALLPYPGFLLLKKAYCEVAQLQGKEIRKMGRFILGVLTVALRQPLSAQVVSFKHALGCLRALVELNMMAQYRSHISDTIAYC